MHYNIIINFIFKCSLEQKDKTEYLIRMFKSLLNRAKKINKRLCDLDTCPKKASSTDYSYLS